MPPVSLKTPVGGGHRSEAGPPARQVTCSPCAAGESCVAGLPPGEVRPSKSA